MSTLSESVNWSFVRSVVVATLALGPLNILLRQTESLLTGRARQMWIAAAILPLFVPELLIGFNYHLTATQLSAGYHPLFASAATEVLYGLIQMTRSLAVGVAVSLLMPGSSAICESIHSWRMLRPVIARRVWIRGWVRLLMTGPLRRHFVSWSLMALVVFQEFETAALMQIDRHPIAWTVWLFDAHAAYQPLLQSMRMTLSPLVCELLLLLPAFALIVSGQRTETPTASVQSSIVSARQDAVGKRARINRTGLKAGFCLAPGLFLCLIWPLAANAAPASRGLMALTRNTVLLRQSAGEIAASLCFAAGSTFLSMMIASFLLDRRKRPGVAVSVGRACCLLPGLLGSLVLSLTLLTGFQSPLLRVFYDTWLPMLLGLTLSVLPRSIAVVLLLRHATDSTAAYSAELLSGSPIETVRTFAAMTLWRLRSARWLMGALVVAHWCFWDVTAASILHPVSVEPVVTRLYNEMHYGRTEALMSLSIAAACAPGLVWLVVLGLTKAISRFGPRSRQVVYESV